MRPRQVVEDRKKAWMAKHVEEHRQHREGCGKECKPRKIKKSGSNASSAVPTRLYQLHGAATFEVIQQ